MGKCVDQVNFMEKWNKRQGLKIAISQQFSNFSMIILVALFTFLYEVQFHMLTVLSAFVIYYMCDGSIASIASPITY